ncbi:MMPL family transporter [Mycobacterium sp. MYCO198283]|uniref:MMPL family transporter n=1 Tax=Mycobacterium sp. MYCO198283 TaxID=2883505 RepID=UPI001E355EC7|nr:MMPL family transporter [Mycobacterium sp. MYCO198283]MCG5432164.1 MMPL family transporter [Mycobacterium sp. MYCO198283]
MPAWMRFAAVVTSRRSWALAVLLVVAGAAAMALLGSSGGAERSPVVLPADTEAARAAAAAAHFPGGDQAPVILVVTRTDDGRLSPADIAAVDAARNRLAPAAAAGGPPLQVSADGEAALAPVPLDPSLTGFSLTDEVERLRAAARESLPSQLRAEITGGPAFGADIADSFKGANVTLLAVTGAVVALLLIVTYRSPILWLVPLAVIGLADRVGSVAGTAAAEAFGLSVDGSTSGITSVLVFGAGTNYALLLISRYREELERVDERSREERQADERSREERQADERSREERQADERSRVEHDRGHRDALRTAVRHAGPAIAASNATVVLALLTLAFATSPSTRSLGVQAASGLLIAALFVLVVLPPLLALCGTRLFWPFIPRRHDNPSVNTGVWHRIAAWVSGHAGRVAAVSVLVLALLAGAILTTSVGLSQLDQFRVKAESVTGFETLSEHFPSGLTDPTTVVAATDRAADVQRAIDGTPGVVSAAQTGTSPGGLTRWSVVTVAEPASARAFDTVTALRTSVRQADPEALVGGADAEALDARDAAQRDRLVLFPLILLVVLAVLYILLRAALAPLVLVGATVLSALAALGLGGWVSVQLFGFPALDNATPLFALLFLVALGVDYTIFLVTRAREESADHGTREGIVRAVSATGAVITSAGIVLAAVFCVLGVLPLIALTQVGIIVGLGILLDTFIVRTVVIPALFTLIGPRIWWPVRVGP